jgi:hypothetical protein
MMYDFNFMIFGEQLSDYTYVPLATTDPSPVNLVNADFEPFRVAQGGTVFDRCIESFDPSLSGSFGNSSDGGDGADDGGPG